MSTTPLFSDRADAGQQLAKVIAVYLAQLQETGVSAPPLVYALPRGGIPIAIPVAQQLNCPVDIVVAKKIATLQNPELAIGAVTSQGHVLWLRTKFWEKKTSPLRETALRQAQEKAQAQLAKLSPGCPHVNPEQKIAILIDDGIATGMTMAAATLAVKAHNPAQIWICTPVAPPGLRRWLSQWGDRLVILKTPTQFHSVSRFYEKFPQVSTEEALIYLQQHNQPLIIGS